MCIRANSPIFNFSYTSGARVNVKSKIIFCAENVEKSDAVMDIFHIFIITLDIIL